MNTNSWERSLNIVSDAARYLARLDTEPPRTHPIAMLAQRQRGRAGKLTRIVDNLAPDSRDE